MLLCVDAFLVVLLTDYACQRVEFSAEVLIVGILLHFVDLVHQAIVGAAGEAAEYPPESLPLARHRSTLKRFDRQPC